VESTGSGTLLTVRSEYSNDNAATYQAGSGTAAYLYDQSSSIGEPGDHDAIAMDAAGNGWIVGSRNEPGQQEGLAWQITNGSVSTTAYWQQKITSTGKTYLRGVSRDGLAVGYDTRVGRGGTEDGPIIAKVYDPNASMPEAGWVIEPFGADTKGQGHGISSNGLWATGYFEDAASANLLHGFRNDVTENSTTELFPVGFDSNADQLSLGNDVADNGWVVGYSYNAKVEGVTVPGYRATIWFDGDQGQLLEQALMDQGVDVYAAGFQYLERAVAVSDDGMIIAGRGIDQDDEFVGFVAMLPEPGALTLFAVGALPMLRRCRRRHARHQGGVARRSR
jgi:hypothetical protein